MKLLLCLSLFCLMFLNRPLGVSAVSNPLELPNNRFGIHIIDEHDLEQAASLVNSQAGDWGYVTVVIRSDDRNLAKWQETFNRMRRLHLIPLVRLATLTQDGVWLKPTEADLDPWLTFLNSLNWVVKNRYIILFNEPNHSKEWGGTIDPVEYAALASAYSQKFRAASRDFFILPAGIDLAAANTADTMAAADFYSQIYTHQPDYFLRFDGWTSHSYPNPGFASSPAKIGRDSLAGYRWERSLVTSYGAPGDLPLFITETGWSSSVKISSPLPLSDYYRTAYEQVWTEPYIAAITPFLLHYSAEPFWRFSWTDSQTRQPLPHFSTVQNLAKIAGRPAQIFDAQSTKSVLPSTIPTATSLMAAISFKNTGQSIWDARTVNLLANTSLPPDSLLIDPIASTEPGEITKVWLKLSTPTTPGYYPLTVQLYHNQLPFGEPVTLDLEIVETPHLVAQFRLWLTSLIHPKDLFLLLLTGRGFPFNFPV